MSNAVPPRLIKGSIPLEFLTRKAKPLRQLLLHTESLADLRRNWLDWEKVLEAAPVSESAPALAKRVEALANRNRWRDNFNEALAQLESLTQEVGKQVAHYERALELTYEQAFLLSKMIPKLQADVKSCPRDADGSPSALAKALNEADPEVLNAAADFRQQIINDYGRR